MLVRTACQDCAAKFDVAVESPGHQHGLNGIEILALFAEFTVGDPPNIGCCAAGPTMTSEELELLEFWERQDFNWGRRTDLEGPLSGDFDSALRRIPAMNFAVMMNAKERYFKLIEEGNEAALAALMTQAGHHWPDIAASAAIKCRKFHEQRLRERDLT